MTSDPVANSSASAQESGEQHRFAMLGFVVLAVVTVTYAIDILPVIGPEVVKDIGTTASVIDLGGTMLLAAAGGFVMLVGQAGDKYSHKLVFIWWGCGLMIVGGLLASFPPNGSLLLLGRFLIGVGAVGMAVPCVAFLNLKFPVGDKARGLAFGLFASGFGLGFVLAPILGGLLGDVSNGWRYASLIVPLFAVICLVGIAATVVISAGPNRSDKLDIGGSILLLVAMSGLIISLNEGPSYGWLTETSPFVIEGWEWPLDISMPLLLGLLSVVVWIWFALYERRLNKLGRAAVLDFALFASRSFRIGLVGCFLFFLSAFAAILVIPQFFLFALGVDTLTLGFSLLPIGIGIVVFGYLAGPIGNKYGGPQTVIAGFVAMTLGSLALLPVMGTGSNGWLTAIPLFLFGIGFGLVYARITQTVLATVPPAKAGLGGATMFGIRLLGGAFGAVLLTLILVTTAADKAKDELSAQASTLSSAQVEELTSLVDRGAKLRQEAGGMNQLAGDRSYQKILQDEELKPAVADIADSYSFSFRITMVLVALISVLGAIVTLRLPKAKDA